ncbi:MAG: nucleoside deaminase [Candidatus Binataceae bacterium]
MDEFMQAAIDEALAGLREGGIPIGSVLVKRGSIIGRGRNRRVQNHDPIAHAEIDCLRNAGRIGGFSGAFLYSTLMPCFMCAGAAAQFGISRIVVGDAETYSEPIEFLRSRGVALEMLNLAECREMLADFIRKNPDLWKEDAGAS